MPCHTQIPCHTQMPCITQSLSHIFRMSLTETLYFKSYPCRLPPIHGQVHGEAGVWLPQRTKFETQHLLEVLYLGACIKA